MYKRTNIDLDTNLVKTALNLTGKGTIKDVVHYALEELIAMAKRKSILKLKGKVKWEGNLDEMRQV